MLVRTFAQLGCQQLQLNSLSLDTLLDVKAHPENYKNLIVRVWGWSGYFCELAPEYQDHIILPDIFIKPIEPFLRRVHDDKPERI